MNLENCPQIQSKTKQKRKFPSVDKPLQIQAPPKISPSKRAFEKYKPRGLFSEFYGITDRSRYKFGGKLALFMQFGTFFMTKAKQDKMKCLF